MIKRKLATFMLTLILVMTGVSTIRVIGYAQEESSGSSTNLQEGVTEYKYSAESDSQKGVALKVEWNEPKLGEDTTFHVSADGGSGRYLFRMDAPSYSTTRVSIVLNPWRIQAAERGFNIQMSANLTTLNSQ